MSALPRLLRNSFPPALAPVCLFAGLAQAALPLAVDGEPLPSLAPMLEKAQPAVVNLSTTTRLRSFEHPLMRDPFFRRFFNMPNRPRRGSSVGSGVIVDAGKGYIITNHHVIEHADAITVTTRDGRELEAKLVGSDAGSDIAIIQTRAERLAEIPLGNSAGLRVGDFVVAIGSPFGLSQTVTSGIVSALGRSGLGIEGYEDFIQTDASINPGNSGGALVDLRGRLVGINTAIFSRGGGSVGIGFAIPIDMVKKLMAQLIEHGNIRRGLLGVTMQDLTPPLADAFGIEGKRGAVVVQVLPGSAASEAGLREDDIIVQLNDTPVADSADLRNAVGLLRPGAEARVRFYRDGKLKRATTRIKESGYLAAHDRELLGRFSGAKFRNAERSAAHDAGVEVVEVARASPAAQAGLAVGDVVLSVNRRRVRSIEEMERAVRGAEAMLLIKISRGARKLLLVLR
ncbi:MAG: DegQ family serine endoprotease [Gammaproteobacteria bacterium]